jgi:hypothetical protein
LVRIGRRFSRGIKIGNVLPGKSRRGRVVWKTAISLVSGNDNKWMKRGDTLDGFQPIRSTLLVGIRQEDVNAIEYDVAGNDGAKRRYPYEAVSRLKHVAL